jgi:glycosyltransferase involved in cell wall biosynthesis
VVPLGVDLDIFKPGDRREARKWIGLPDECLDAFIVGNINRNQPRKRLDLTIRYFAEWIKRYQIEDAYLYLHVCPTGDTGIDCNQLSNYYGIPGKLILAEPDVWKGASLEHVARTYQCFDAQINTALGEGFGLTSLEGMAAGVVQIGPDIAAFGPLGWPGDAMIRLPYEETVFSSPTNQIGGVIDREAVIETLQLLYKSGFDRWQMREKGLALANRPEFRWYNIGVAFAEELEKALLDHATNEDAIHAERVQGDASQARTSGVPIS